MTEEDVYLTPMTPTNLAYTSYLLSTVSLKPFYEGLGALLPCYWIYLEVGKELEKKGSPNPLYKRWIDTYSSAEYEKVVRVVLEVMERICENLDENGKRAVKRNFRTTSIYEYLFWDSAYKMERWPLETP